MSFPRLRPFVQHQPSIEYNLIRGRAALPHEEYLYMIRLHINVVALGQVNADRSTAAVLVHDIAFHNTQTFSVLYDRHSSKGS